MSKKLISLSLIFILILIASAAFPACSPSPAAPAPASSTTAVPISTEFGKMLGKVPYSFLKEQDVWFGNPDKAWELHGIEGRGIDSIKDLPLEKSSDLMATQVGIYIMMKSWRTEGVASLTGFDGWMVDRVVLTERPPASSSVNEGDFAEELIKSKLLEQGYTRVEYAPYSYYSIRDDNEPDLRSDLSNVGVLTELNKIAVLDNTIVTASTAVAIEGILDVMFGKEPSVMDNAATQALADSLGEVLSGVIMDPSRVLNRDPSQETDPFYFDIPADWGLLHPYDMLGMGNKFDGKESSWVISLFYADAQAASADADTLVNRIRSYRFYSQNSESRQWAKRDFAFYGYSIGEPVIKTYPGGATLTVECQGKPWHMQDIYFRDLLFLALDPSPYVKK